MKSRLSKLEDYDHRKSCRLDGGIVRDDGSSWNENCQVCSCVVSKIQCQLFRKQVRPKGSLRLN